MKYTAKVKGRKNGIQIIKMSGNMSLRLSVIIQLFGKENVVKQSGNLAT
jgi:hypothetical protein